MCRALACAQYACGTVQLQPPLLNQTVPPLLLRAGWRARDAAARHAARPGDLPHAAQGLCRCEPTPGQLPQQAQHCI